MPLCVCIHTYIARYIHTMYTYTYLTGSRVGPLHIYFRPQSRYCLFAGSPGSAIEIGGRAGQLLLPGSLSTEGLATVDDSNPA